MTKSLTLKDSIGKLAGIGPKRVEGFHSLGVESLEDVLHHFPFRYEDMSQQDISLLEDKQNVVLAGEVINEAVVNYFGHRKSRLQFRMKVDRVVVPVVFFNQPYYKDRIKVGQNIMIYGRWDGKRLSLSGQRVLSDDHEDDFEPIYPGNKSLPQKTIIQAVKDAWQAVGHQITDVLPASLRQKYRLISHADAIKAIHFPSDGEESQRAQKQIKYEELFLYQMKIQAKKFFRRKEEKGQIIDYDVEVIKEFISTLPFEPTAAQKRVINEICRDFKQPYKMQRLLQGDVGSGKTLVAAAAMIAVWSTGKQSALMAPTEILAEQHVNSLSKFFEPFDVHIALLTGSTHAKSRRYILEALASGEIDILVGTHALFQEGVHYHDLGFVVTDEQHRFGVNQRIALENKGEAPDVLHMTATPIPRTLAITTFGEMDVSIIDEMPKGRKPIQTYWVRPRSEERVVENVAHELNAGSQAYIISPLIDESEMLDLNTAVEIYERYQSYFSPKYTVGLLHGQMKSDEKDAVMEAFKNNEIQILVSTTVIEVGVDVPNATMMVIYDADRFGLAQLHQLRGRVGRGDKQSYCILVGEPKTEIGAQRLALMTETNDGFLLSQKDLEWRGPGDVFGSRQSGIPEFKLADLIVDYPILEQARRDAVEMIQAEDFFTNKEYTTLRNKLNINEEE